MGPSARGGSEMHSAMQTPKVDNRLNWGSAYNSETNSMKSGLSRQSNLRKAARLREQNRQKQQEENLKIDPNGGDVTSIDNQGRNLRKEQQSSDNNHSVVSKGSRANRRQRMRGARSGGTVGST